MQDASNLPGNAAGQFSDGNPSTGVDGTTLLSQYQNDLMNNIIYIITQAGTGLTDDDQADLFDALVALFPTLTNFLVEHNSAGTHKLISVPSATVNDTVFFGKLTADTIARIGLIVAANGGQIVLGDGTVVDISIARTAAKTITIDDNSSGDLTEFVVRATDSSFSGDVNLDAAKRLHIGGSNLYEGATNQLKTDNALVVGNDVILGSGKALYAPNVEGSVKSQGSNTSVSSGKLIDSSATFSTDSVVAGDIVRNDTTYAKTTVVTVDSETQLTLSADIFTSTGNPYRVVIKDTANSGKFLGGNGGFMWFDGVTIGTTAITLDSTIDWRDRWISITARIAFYTTPSDYVPGGTFDNTLTGHLGQLSGSLAAFVTDFLATTFYSEAGSAGGGALPHGKLSNVDADDVDIWADSTNGDLKIGKPSDTGDEAAFGLFVIFSDDQGHY